MWTRVGALVRAWLTGEWFGERGQRLPLGPLFLHGSLACGLCLAVRAELGPYAYALFALSLPLILASMPLLGELAPLLRADTAADWVSALPIRPFELRLARVLCIGALLGGLTLCSLLPGVLLAPDSLGLAARLLMLLAGLLQAALVAALLLAMQALFDKRAESMLVLVQTALFCGTIVGAVLGLRYLPTLAAIQAPSGALSLYPPACFASWVLPAALERAPLQVWSALLASVAALTILACAPFPPPLRARSTRTPLALLLAPLRRLAISLWVRRSERASFDLVYDALPTERDFVLRAYPLVAIPLAFLLIGESSEDAQGGGLLALLSFTPAIYLPVLLLHVPATATPAARWIFDTAPLAPADEREGAIKAIAVRFLAPLYLALLAVCLARGGLDIAGRIFGPALVAGLCTLRAVYPACVQAPPLSLSVQELPAAFGEKFSGVFLTLAIAQTLLAILCWRFIPNPGVGIAIFACVLVFEIFRARRLP